ncbi:MAG: hypothetical protein ACUVSU_03960 [Aggregatilineaceae bacterium]
MSNTPLSNRDLELLSAYLDNELRPAERDALNARLAHDAELRIALAELRANRLLLRQAPRLKAPRSFALDPAQFSRSLPWWQRLFIPGVLQASGTLGAVAAIALIAVGLLLGTGARPTPTTAQPAAEIAFQPTLAAMPPTSTLAATISAAPTVAPTAPPTATVAISLEAQASEPELAAPAPMLAQPGIPAATQADIFADAFPAEAGAEGIGAGGAVVPPAAGQLRDVPGGASVPPVAGEESGASGALLPTPTPLEESPVGEAIAMQPSPSPMSAPLQKEAVRESASTKEKPWRNRLVLGGIATLIVSGALFALGAWKGRHP